MHAQVPQPQTHSVHLHLFISLTHAHAHSFLSFSEARFCAGSCTFSLSVHRRLASVVMTTVDVQPTDTRAGVDGRREMSACERAGRDESEWQQRSKYPATVWNIGYFLQHPDLKD